MCCRLMLMGLSSQPFSQIGINVLRNADRTISDVYNIFLLTVLWGVTKVSATY